MEKETDDNIVAKAPCCKRIVFVAANMPHVIDTKMQRDIGQMVADGYILEHMKTEDVRRSAFGCKCGKSPNVGTELPPPDSDGGSHKKGIEMKTQLESQNGAAACSSDIVSALVLLGLTADKIFERIRCDLDRGLASEARGHLNFVDELLKCANDKLRDDAQ